MPLLPSGLKFAISRDALFDHGGNWFKCPDGHFWYWAADPEIMGPGPYKPGQEIIRSAEHAPAPKTIEEAKKYIYVLESEEDGKWGWRGEWLQQFPSYRTLSAEDVAAWSAWLESSDIQDYLRETVNICQRLADDSRRASGMSVFSSSAGG
jgi:hypothetical protein